MIAQPSPARQENEEPPGLYEVLSARARELSDGALWAATITGVVVLAAVIVMRPGWWEVAFPFVAGASIGAWGLSAHYLAWRGDSLPSAQRLAMVIGQWFIAAIGTTALIGTGYAIVGILIGPVQS